MKSVLVTGSQGFIGSYLCLDLLKRGYNVTGIDNFSKYGQVVRAHDFHPNFTLQKMDLARANFGLGISYDEFDYIIAGAAMIGGISYFHKHAYDLLATNEKILANTFDYALNCRRFGRLEKIVVISSSMVLENTRKYPTPEDETKYCPPPESTYGFQKLSCEYFAKGAWEQYGLPYTIVRPFNCVGIGEEDAIPPGNLKAGNIKLQLSHVVPDLIERVLLGQDPLEILGSGEQIRCYTNGADVSRGIIMAMEDPIATNETFNISTNQSTSVLELAHRIWQKIRGDEEFRFKLVPPYKYDVQKRIPDVTKAYDMLGFEAEISLNQSLDEVIKWMRTRLHK